MWKRKVFGMLASQRQKQIQALLQENGAVTIAGLMEEFGISMETARRDLAAMEKNGLLQRVHGGALPLNTAPFYRPLAARMQDQLAQKQAIARAAAVQVQEGDYIAIGGGSTAASFARALRNRVRRLTVVTYSMDVFEILQDMPQYTILFTGGNYQSEERSFQGPAVAAFLSKTYVQKAFLFPSVLSLEDGYTCLTEELAHRLSPMIRNSDQVYILADSSKFEHKIRYQVTPLRQDFIYITDTELPEDLRKKYADNHLNFFFAE